MKIYRYSLVVLLGIISCITNKDVFAGNNVGCGSAFLGDIDSNCQIDSGLDQNGNCTLTGCMGTDHIYNLFAINQCSTQVSGGSFWSPNFSCTQTSQIGEYYGAPLNVEGCANQASKNLPAGKYCNNCDCEFDSNTTLLNCDCAEPGLYGYYSISFYTNACSGEIVNKGATLSCEAKGQSATDGLRSKNSSQQILKNPPPLSTPKNRESHAANEK